MRKTDKLNAQKTAKTAIVVNTLQILAVLVFVVYVLVLSHEKKNPIVITILLVCTTANLLGAVIDIVDALEALRREYSINALLRTNQQMEYLNQGMRKQRHDFLNHLQVVYSLIEMNETDDALAYLDHTYANLISVSRFLRTKNTAFNALLQAKSGVCEEKGISFDMNIHSALDQLIIPAWEFCSVVGNVIDNAIDAVASVQKPHISICVHESMQMYTIRIANNGTLIPAEEREKIFLSGYSTKGSDRGLGLAISREIVEQYGATLNLETKQDTSFVISIPKIAQSKSCKPEEELL